MKKKEETAFDYIRQIVKESVQENKAILYPHNTEQLNEAVEKIINEKLEIVVEEEDDKQARR